MASPSLATSSPETDSWLSFSFTDSSSALRLATVSSLSVSLDWRACNFSESPAVLLALERVLNRFLAGSVDEEDVLGRVVVDVVEGRVRGRVAVVDVVVRLAGPVAEVSRPTGLLVEVAVREAVVLVAGFFSRLEPATLDLRSRVEEVFNGARVEAVPAIDMRLAVLEIPRFSSPELAIDRGFSSAELLMEGLDR